jgi:hypothetical protein
VREVFIPKPHAYVTPAKLEQLAAPETTSNVRIFVNCPDAIELQVRKVNARTVTIAGVGLHLEEARVVRDRLEEWIRDQEHADRDRSADVDVVLVPQDLVDAIKVHLAKSQLHGVTFEETAELQERIRSGS